MLDKKVVSQCISSDYCHGWNDAVDAMPRWISVEERLPEDQKNILTVNGHREIRVMALWHKHGDSWTWILNERFRHFNDITHWMPLPEPPEEVRHE